LTHRVQASASCQRPPSLSARVQPGAVCGPQAPDHPQRSATGGAAGDARGRGDETRGLATEGGRLRSHQADGVGRDGAAGRQKAAVTDLSKASGHDRREASAEQLQGVESGRAWACTAALTGGAGDGAVLARDDAAVGDGALEDLWGEVLDGRVAVGVGLAVDVPVGFPGQWIARPQQSRLGHIFFAERAGDG
jgi:hypothetical protein